MAKELEIKILNVNIEEIKKKLDNINAKLICDTMQKIYTYDFIDISSMYESILFDLKENKSEKIINHAMKRLKQLLFDLNDLILEKDFNGNQRKIIKELFGTENIFEYYCNNIKSYNDIDVSLLENEELLNIIKQYRINPNKWIRLRKSGNETTLTVKQILGRRTNEFGVREHSISNVLEYETGVTSFETTKEILEQLGYYHKNYQEKRRISYVYNDIEIDIDHWPHIPPYIEVEAHSEKDIFDFLHLIGYTKEDTVSMNADDVYTHYGLDMYSYKELKFDD